MYKPEQPVPTYLTQERFILIQRKPDKISLPDNMILRNEAPVTGVGRIMTVVPHHPEVIHLESILICRGAVNIYYRILYLQLILLVCPDNTVIKR